MYKVKRNCGEDLGKIWAFCADQYYLMIVVVLTWGTKSNIIRNIFIWRVECLIHNGILYSFVTSGMNEISIFFYLKTKRFADLRTLTMKEIVKIKQQRKTTISFKLLFRERSNVKDCESDMDGQLKIRKHSPFCSFDNIKY